MTPNLIDSIFIMIKQLSKSTQSILPFFVQAFKRSRVLESAASLTFTSTLAVVPLLAVILSLFTAFPIFAHLQNEIEAFMSHNLMPESISSTVMTYLNNFALKASSITAWGSVFLIITSILLIKTIDDSLNRIANIKHQRPIVQRILIYWAVLSLGPMFLGGSLWVTSWLAKAELGISALSLGKHLSYNILHFSLFSIAFSLLYYIVPNHRIFFRDALVGGLTASILIQIMKSLFTWYITAFPSYALIYGAFATIPLFLLWIYLSWIIVLTGAVIATCLPWLRTQALDTSTHAGDYFAYAWQILAYLYQARQARKSEVSTYQISRDLRLPYTICIDLLYQLKKLKFCTTSKSDRWLLSCPNHMPLNALVDHFLFAQNYQNSETVNLIHEILIQKQTVSLEQAMEKVHDTQ